MDQETKKKLPRIFFFLAAILLLVKVYQDKKGDLIENHITGLTMGTIPYSVKYRMVTETDLKPSIDSILVIFNESLSTYIPDSEISDFNNNDTLLYRSELFLPVMKKSAEVFSDTEGAFDPTIGPLVNAWGFGATGRMNPSPDQIDSLLNFVGFKSVNFNDQYATKPKGFYIDFSAVAKGYAVDLVGEFLEDLGIENYMVEIGGEVRTLGMNGKNEIWSIGIEDPLVDQQEQKIMAIVNLQNRSVATSGNYRNYYEIDGKTYAHIIDPRTGYTSSDSILSASVFAPDCMTADAYATAFMVMGYEKVKNFISAKPELDAILVYREADSVKRYVTAGVKEFVTLR